LGPSHKTLIASADVGFLSVARIALASEFAHRGLLEAMSADADASSRGKSMIHQILDLPMADDLSARTLQARRVGWGCLMFMEAARRCATAEARFEPEPDNLLCGGFAPPATAVIPKWLQGIPIARLHAYLRGVPDSFCHSCAAAISESIAAQCRISATELLRRNWKFIAHVDKGINADDSPVELSREAGTGGRKRSRDGSTQPSPAGAAADFSGSGSGDGEAPLRVATRLIGGKRAVNVIGTSSSSGSASPPCAGSPSPDTYRVDLFYVETRQSIVGPPGPHSVSICEDHCFCVMPP